MLLVDVNPLLYALRADEPDHVAWRRWLEQLAAPSRPTNAFVGFRRHGRTPTIDDVFSHARSMPPSHARR
jgi:predicted nucleic acid-binding protein